MKKLFRNTVSLVLAALMLLSLTSVCMAAGNTETAPIRFGEDGKLNIMHVTDCHLSADNVEDSVWMIGKACDREQPDIAVLTGDIAMADTVEETCRLIDLLMNEFETRNIPVAVTFGNHDSEKGIISREDLMAYYNGFSCSISLDDGEELSGCGTYCVPVLASGSEETEFVLWIFDSGDYDGEGHYANVLEDQVEWYKEKSLAFEQAAGEKVYSLAFQHIIVPEIYDALREVKLRGAYTYPRIYDTSRYYAFDPANENHGMLHEYPCPGYYNHGQFEAMVERGDVLAMFTGHDHTNAFSVKYKGINITNSLSTRYNGEVFSTQYGYRMITVNENDPSTYSTHAVHWYDFFSLSDAFGYSDDNGHGALALKVYLFGMLEKVAISIGVFFTETFSGRTVRYPD